MSAGKIKLGDYDLRVIVTGMMKYRDTASAEDLEIMDPMLLWLFDIIKALKPGRRTKCLFNQEEKRLVCFYLNEWRNQFIQENNLGGMDGVCDVMLKFLK